jgi:hypothetical protein
MNTNRIKIFVVFLAGIAAGAALSELPAAVASSDFNSTDLGTRKFRVFIDEVKQNFVFGEEFSGHYSKVVTLSDGSKRTVELTPTVHDGMQVVELKDSGAHSYMSLNGTTTNGPLMVGVRDEAEDHRLLKSQGWRIP